MKTTTKVSSKGRRGSAQAMFVSAQPLWDDDFERRVRAAHARDVEGEKRADALLEIWRTKPRDNAALRAWIDSAALTPDMLAYLLFKVEDFGVSQSQAQRAARKNAEPKAWVQQAWEANNTGAKLSKAAFSRAMSTRLKTEFPLADNVTARSIETRWLKGL